MRRQSSSQRSRLRALGLFVFCALLVLCVLTWIVSLVWELEDEDARTRQAAEHHEAMILALWRMDSWFAPYLSRESDRPYAHYYPFYAYKQSFTDALIPKNGSETLIPSPLLRLESPFMDLHLQIDSMGHVDSPQVPTGSFLAPTLTYVTQDMELERSRKALDEWASVLEFAALRDRVLNSEGFVEEVRQVVPSRDDDLAESPPASERRIEWIHRAEGAYDKRLEDTCTTIMCFGVEGFEEPRIPERVENRPFVPLWIEDVGGEDQLWFWRRVLIDEDEVLQGFWLRWPEVKKALLARIEDRFPGAELIPFQPTTIEDAAAEFTLATMGVQLVVQDPEFVAPPPWTVTRAAVGSAWLAVLIGILAIGWTLRSSLEMGERRYRFASVVTHELRTPLTTFKLYTDMLASDMVKDPEARSRYIETLRQESHRLSHIVENVLAYSRLEEGHARPALEWIRIEALLDRLGPKLIEYARSHEMQLEIDEGDCDATPLRTDPDSVYQIFLNLVDNSCKYAKPEHGSAKIWIEVRSSGSQVAFRVRDQGPGISKKALASIFQPFERVEPREDRTTPGIGVGLTLARGLAQKLGGDLIARETDGGALFELTLPVSGDHGEPG